MSKRKFFIITTVGRTLFFFKDQPRLWHMRFDVTAISAERENLVEFAKQEGINYKYMPMHREISLMSDVLCLLRFIWLFVKERPYVVHGNTPKASMLSMVAAWLTMCPVRIYMCHGLRYQSVDKRLRLVLMIMEWLSCHCATEVLCVSGGVKKQLVMDGLCSSKKAKVVRYGTAGGVDAVFFSRENTSKNIDVRQQLKIPNEAVVFCFVGRVVKDKGVNELLSAFDRLSKEMEHCYLLLVGATEKKLDPINEHSEALITANSRIYAVGRQADIRPYLAASNALVLPSYREGVGMVILEANAMNVPCIASDIIGCRDIIAPLVNGELVEARNADALYEKMKKWVEHPEIVKEMANQCREYVLLRYSHTDVIKAYDEEYSRFA